MGGQSNEPQPEVIRAIMIVGGQSNDPQPEVIRSIMWEESPMNHQPDVIRENHAGGQSNEPHPGQCRTATGRPTTARR